MDCDAVCHSSTTIDGGNFFRASSAIRNIDMTIARLTALLSLSACVSAILGPSGNGTKSKTDTYLDAYSKSRIEAEKAKKGVIIVTAKDGEKKISNRDDSYSSYDYSSPYSSDSFTSAFSGSSGPPTNYLPSSNPVKFESDITYNAPANNYGPPPQKYGPPAQSYGSPAPSYGAPAHTYGPPAQIFGPPAQTYGPPSPAYGLPKPPPPVYGPPPSYGVPYTAPALGFLDKLSLKLDILTIAKLLLKLLIFKKIVTMIAVVCMLLVIPKLISFKKDSGSSNDEDERKFGGGNVLELTSAQQLVERAIAVYGRQQPGCGVTCRARRVIDDIYEFEPYIRYNALRDFRSTS